MAVRWQMEVMFVKKQQDLRMLLCIMLMVLLSNSWYII